MFLTQPGIINILQQSSINDCIALGMPLVIISGGFDLSVGPVAALSAVLGAAEPTLGTLWGLDAIAAAAIGGASLMGGCGSIVRTLIGCIIPGALRNGLTLLNVRAFYQLLATGITIIVAMLIDKAASGQQGH